jgi:hypothetical protein
MRKGCFALRITRYDILKSGGPVALMLINRVVRDGHQGLDPFVQDGDPRGMFLQDYGMVVSVKGDRGCVHFAEGDPGNACENKRCIDSSESNPVMTTRGFMACSTRVFSILLIT